MVNSEYYEKYREYKKKYVDLRDRNILSLQMDNQKGGYGDFNVHAQNFIYRCRRMIYQYRNDQTVTITDVHLNNLQNNLNAWVNFEGGNTRIQLHNYIGQLISQMYGLQSEFVLVDGTNISYNQEIQDLFGFDKEKLRTDYNYKNLYLKKLFDELVEHSDDKHMKFIVIQFNLWLVI